MNAKKYVVKDQTLALLSVMMAICQMGMVVQKNAK